MGSSGEIEFSKNLIPPTPDLSGKKLQYSMIPKYHKIIMIIVNACCILVVEPFFLNMGTYVFLNIIRIP